MFVTDHTSCPSVERGVNPIVSLPPPGSFVMPNMKWGQCHEILSPAYWAQQAWIADREGQYRNLALGKSLKEEIVACLLGGHGISAEVGLAFFHHIKSSGLLREPDPTFEKIYALLSDPVSVNGRLIHYRFAKRKSTFLCEVLRRLEYAEPPLTRAYELRDWLLGSPGIGPKTASWIVRNWLNSDDVAIIDIHIYRAGCYMGLFQRTKSIDHAYYVLEKRFLDFASKLSVRASLLDSLMWDHMRRYGTAILKLVEA